jgi:hypothetical protein
VNVRHGQTRDLNTWQGRNVSDLVWRLITSDLLDQVVACVDQPVDSHVRPVAARDPPAIVVHPFKGAVKSFFVHDVCLASQLAENRPTIVPLDDVKAARDVFEQHARQLWQSRQTRQVCNSDRSEASLVSSEMMVTSDSSDC